MADARTEGQATVLKILGGTADDYDAIVAESTLGRDAHWKRWILQRMIEPKQVLDLASGTGILSFLVLDRFPGTHVTGVDLQEDYQAVAVGRSKQRDLEDRTTWIRSAVEDAELPDGTFDHIITCYLPKYADRPVVATLLAKWCAPGGRLLLHDFAHPTNPKVDAVLRQQYDRWLDKVKRECPHWIPCFEDLYDIVKSSTWTDDFPGLLEEAGFEDVELTFMHQKTAAFITARKPE